MPCNFTHKICMKSIIPMHFFIVILHTQMTKVSSRWDVLTPLPLDQSLSFLSCVFFLFCHEPDCLACSSEISSSPAWIAGLPLFIFLPGAHISSATLGLLTEKGPEGRHVNQRLSLLLLLTYLGSKLADLIDLLEDFTCSATISDPHVTSSSRPWPVLRYSKEFGVSPQHQVILVGLYHNSSEKNRH